RVVQPSEIDGTLTDLAVQGDVRVDVEVRAGRREIVVGGLDRGRAVREALAIDHRRRPADQEDVRRLEEDAAAELRRALSSDDLYLVRVVMEDAPEPLEVHLRKRPRDDFCEPVRDAVRVADPLALDDFRALLFDRRVDEFLDVDISRHGKPPTAVPRGCGGAYMAFVARPHEVDGTLTEYGGLPDTVHRPIICDGPENSGRNMYRMPVARPDDARLGGGPPPADGPRAHTD